LHILTKEAERTEEQKKREKKREVQKKEQNTGKTKSCKHAHADMQMPRPITWTDRVG